MSRSLQFSMRHVFAVFLALGVLLALTTQLRHVGLVAWCYLVGAAVGWRLRRAHWTAASITALLVFVITYLGSWMQAGSAPQVEKWRFRSVEQELDQIRAAIASHSEAQGEPPESLPDLADPVDFPFRRASSDEILDPWGHPYHYRRQADQFELASLGRDGALGGVGLDADVYYGQGLDSASLRLPLGQFLFDTPASDAVFLVALLASLLAASLWRGAEKTFEPTWPRLIAGVAVTVVSAAVVAVFLALFHVAASQSGH